ncbi:MAG TPA: high frequency lysogenization protein HflD [Gammaproteobacteria bacterium]|nr:high frequency lysogenization protein HflD [Gammaproteobacteria bacterium]
MRPLPDRVLALAGVVQAATLVCDAASGASADETSLQATLESILKTETRDVPDVYGGLRGVGLGLKKLAELLGSDRTLHDLSILRYSLSLLQLQGKVMQSGRLRRILEDSIARGREQVRHFGLTHGNVLANLADTYSRTAGSLEPRILVTGDAQKLRNPLTINLVRSLLLGGLRSAVLWRQCGGSRWMLLLMRASLRKETQRLLKESGRFA